jgi:hypothetical protein
MTAATHGIRVLLVHYCAFARFHKPCILLHGWATAQRYQPSGPFFFAEQDSVMIYNCDEDTLRPPSRLTACGGGHGICKFPITIAFCGDLPAPYVITQTNPCANVLERHLLAASMWNVLLSNR